MKTKITQNPNINSFRRFVKNDVKKKASNSLLFIFLIAVFLIPKSVNAFEISAVKAPSDGAEIMKKYSIVRAVDDDGYVIAGSTPSTHFLGRMSIHIKKVNDNGSIDWSYYYNIPNTSKDFEVTHIDYSVNDGYVVSGYTNALVSLGSRDVTPVVIEVSSVGVYMQNAYLSTRGVYLKIKPTPKGNYIAVGFWGDTTLSGPKFALCVKLDAAFNPIWSRLIQGDYPFNSPLARGTNAFFEGFNAVYVTYDGIDETYVLGGNTTGPLEINSNDYYVPIIELRELDENGVLINQNSFYSYGGTTKGRDLIVQDILVVEDPLSQYNGEVFLLAQEWPTSDYGNTSIPLPFDYFMVIGRFQRSGFIPNTDLFPFEGAACPPNAYHSCRGNNFFYLKDRLYIVGTQETSGGGHIVQIPFIADVNPALPFQGISTLEPCVPLSDFNCTFFSDNSYDIFFDGYRIQFTDYLGTDVNIGLTSHKQVFGQNLGYVDLDGSLNVRYGIVSNKKLIDTNPGWSLFIVSNIDNNFCMINEEARHSNENNYDVFLDTFRVREVTSSFEHYTLLSMSDNAANFHIGVCPEFAGPESFLSNTKNENHFENIIKIYPNPFENIIFTEGLLNSDIIELFDIKGVLILQVKTAVNNELKLDNLPVGLYFLKVIRNGEVVYLEKISKY